MADESIKTVTTQSPFCSNSISIFYLRNPFLVFLTYSFFFVMFDPKMQAFIEIQGRMIETTRKLKQVCVNFS
jgi:hypothetical protein